MNKMQDTNKTLDEVFEKAFDNPGEKGLFDQLENYQALYQHKKRNRLIVKIAAISLLMIGVALIFLMNQQRQPIENKLFSSYYSAFNAPDQYRSLADSSESLSYQAFTLYTEKQYSKASTAFKQLLQVDSVNASYLFYNGICLIEEGNIDSALSSLRLVIQMKDPVFSEPALWYAGLCMVKLKRPQEAITIFETLQSAHTTYSEAALEILTQLKK